MEWEGQHICPYCEGEDTELHPDGRVECHDCGFVWQEYDNIQPQRRRPDTGNAKPQETDVAEVIISVLIFVTLIACIVLMAC